MAERDGHPGVCLDSETVAAYLDDRLDADARRLVEQHLSSCAACRELAVEAFYTGEALTEADELVGVPVGPLEGLGFAAQAAAAESVAERATERQPLWLRWQLLAPLAAAAAVVVAIVTPSLLRVNEVRTAEQWRSDLVAATGPTRSFEARLSGGFEYGPVRVTRSIESLTAASAEAQVTAARAEDWSEGRSSAIARALAGSARLLAGDADGAVTALEEAAKLDPRDPRWHNDLSAALLTRARRSGAETDAQQALKAADQALMLEPRYQEALFNRALAYEALGQIDLARAAWQRYLERDPTSPWADDARRRLADFQLP